MTNVGGHSDWIAGRNESSRPQDANGSDGVMTLTRLAWVISILNLVLVAWYLFTTIVSW